MDGAMTNEDERKAQILAEVTTLIREVIGEEWANETSITMDTTFSQDLEVESIELVALSEKLQERYGATVDFPGWLAAMELDAIIGLTVGQLVDYIASCQSKP
jgi:acyl carrier protein